MKTRTGTLTFVRNGTPNEKPKITKEGILQFKKNLSTQPPQPRKTRGSRYA